MGKAYNDLATKLRNATTTTEVDSIFNESKNANITREERTKLNRLYHSRYRDLSQTSVPPPSAPEETQQSGLQVVREDIAQYTNPPMDPVEVQEVVGPHNWYILNTTTSPLERKHILDDAHQEIKRRREIDAYAATLGLEADYGWKVEDYVAYAANQQASTKATLEDPPPANTDAPLPSVIDDVQSTDTAPIPDEAVKNTKGPDNTEYVSTNPEPTSGEQPSSKSSVSDTILVAGFIAGAFVFLHVLLAH